MNAPSSATFEPVAFYAVMRAGKMIRRVRSENYARRLAREQTGVSGACSVHAERFVDGELVRDAEALYVVEHVQPAPIQRHAEQGVVLHEVTHEWRRRCGFPADTCGWFLPTCSCGWTGNRCRTQTFSLAQGEAHLRGTRGQA